MLCVCVRACVCACVRACVCVNHEANNVLPVLPDKGGLVVCVLLVCGGGCVCVCAYACDVSVCACAYIYIYIYIYLPNGVTIIPWKSGCTLVWDATCTDTFAASHLAQTTGRQGL